MRNNIEFKNCNQNKIDIHTKRVKSHPPHTLSHKIYCKHIFHQI
jgi:hypothetical protein